MAEKYVTPSEIGKIELKLGTDGIILFIKEVYEEEANPQSNTLYVFLPTMRNDTIIYQSTNGRTVAPYTAGTAIFGANILSNTYSDGRGVITFDQNVTKIGQRAFYRVTDISSITMPNSVTSIGQEAFSGCTNLSEIILSTDLISIGNNAFTGCAATAVTYNNTIANFKKISKGTNWRGNICIVHCTDGDYVLVRLILQYINRTEYRDTFTDKNNLIKCEVTENASSITQNEFSECASLREISISDGVTNIGSSAFTNCDSLIRITIPNSVTTIGREAFYDCNNLSEVTIENADANIEYGILNNCTNLQTVILGSEVLQFMSIEI